MKHLLDQFLEKWNAAILPPLEEPLVVGLSGGVDSILLIYFLKHSGYQVIGAHVNYHLRGEESDGDETFVRQFCAQHDIPCEVHSAFHQAHDEKNIQQWARTVRYAFFQEVKKKYRSSWILLAHHKNDQLETMLLQFFRGSYGHYPMGMEASREGILRPLLALSKEEIIHTALGLGLMWREDSSNQKNDYFRNALRNEVWPILSRQDEFWEKKVLAKRQEWEQNAAFMDEMAQRVLHEYLVNEHDDLLVKEDILNHPHRLFLMRHLLQQRRLSLPAEDVLRLFYSIPGKRLEMQGKQVLRERNGLRFTATAKGIAVYELIDKRTTEMHVGEKKLLFSLETSTHIESGPVVQMDADKLEFPLELRTWREGDTFVPLGMKGRKKISDFLIQEKVEREQKQNVLVLCSGGEICWVVGMRMSELFKIEELTTSVLKIRLL